MSKTYPTRLVVRIVTVVLLLSVSLSAFAQQQFSVKLRLSDASNSEPVGFATVSLTLKGARTPSKYVLTSAEGIANLTKVPKGTYVLKAEIMGYRTYEKEIEVAKTVDM